MCAAPKNVTKKRGARELAARNYRFEVQVDWLPEVDVLSLLKGMRESSGRRQIENRSPFSAIPKRLWASLVRAAGIPAERTWADLTKRERNALLDQLTRSDYSVQGKSLNKEEFVTCGGVRLPEIDLRTMQSKLCPGLYFAGEVIDVDGVTLHRLKQQIRDVTLGINADGHYSEIRSLIV